MGLKIVECVPNFSEGRRTDVIQAIADAARVIPGVTILDCENDSNHNRMVLTFVGEPQAVKEAALASSTVAIQKIDLRKHEGEHPRMGAVDVVPFVPLRDVSLQECVALANEFGAEFARRFDVPVFMYEAAATRPERRDLAKVRQGQFEGLRDLIGVDPSKDPDYGPRRIHTSAGATAVGARPVLIAFNVNLNTTNAAIAKKIAHRIRERDGGLSAVKALGFELKDRNLTQVSMNLTNFNTTSIWKAFEAIRRLSTEMGVQIVESEIVGLVPLEAISQTAAENLFLTNFKSSQIIENKLLQIEWEKVTGGVAEDLSNQTLSEFIESVASKKPTPGGGSVSAFSGALAAALVGMVCKLTIGKKGYEEQQSRILEIERLADEQRRKLKNLANEDSRYFSKVSEALALPRLTEDEKQKRAELLHSALRNATLVPAETMKASYEVLNLAKEVIAIGNKNARSDAETAYELSKAAIHGSWSNVKINLETLKDEEFSAGIKKDLSPIISVVTDSTANFERFDRA